MNNDKETALAALRCSIFLAILALLGNSLGLPIFAGMMVAFSFVCIMYVLRYLGQES